MQKNFKLSVMFNNLFTKDKKALNEVNIHEADLVLRLMFEIAISDGSLDKAELNLIRQRAEQIAPKNIKVSTLIKKIIDETEKSVSFYPSVSKINDSYSYEEKIELLKTLWSLVMADAIVDPYEENLYFKIAELIKIKRSIANQIKQETF